jgi:hypothetical protein
MLIASKLGIDDFLVSLWISGLNTALSFWLAPKIKNKYLGSPLLFSLFFFASTLFYFYFTDQVGVLTNQLMGVDKIVLGQSLGLLIMFLGIFIDRYSRKLNGGKILFPYQKVVFPFLSLLLFTLLFKLIFKL